MRKPSVSIHQLVSSLSPREKAFFRKMSKIQVTNGYSEYLKVFNAIEKQKVYDEASIKKQFKDEKFVKHFHKTKEFLYGNLLDALQVFHRKSSALTTMLNIAPKIELLYEKELYDQCLILARKMRKLAESLDSPENIGYAILWELRLTFLQPAKHLDVQHANESLDMLDRIVTEKKSANQYLRSHTELFSNYYGKGQVTTELDLMKIYEKMKLKAIFSEDHEPKGNQARLYYLNFLQVYYQQLQYTENAYSASNELHKFYAERPSLTTGSPHAVHALITVLFNKVLFAVETKRWNVAESVLEELDMLKGNKLVKNSKRLQSAFFTYRSLGGLLFFQRHNSWNKGAEFADWVEEEIDSHEWAIPANRLYEMKFRSMVIQYHNGHLSSARSIANNLMHEAESLIDDGLFQAVLVVRALIYFETESRDISDPIISSTQRAFGKTKVFQAYLEFVSLLSKMVSNDDSKSRIKLMQATRIKLKKMRKDDFESYAFVEFDLVKWITDRLNKGGPKLV